MAKSTSSLSISLRVGPIVNILVEVRVTPLTLTIRRIYYFYERIISTYITIFTHTTISKYI
jgi:hypothetical protein